MHDPEFEKKVQQKMEELVFSPSDEVWTRLERQITGKKRRRLPLFWLFFLSGLLLAGAAGAYFFLNPFAGARGPSTHHTTIPVTTYQESAHRKDVSGAHPETDHRTQHLTVPQANHPSFPQANHPSLPQANHPSPFQAHPGILANTAIPDHQPFPPATSPQAKAPAETAASGKDLSTSPAWTDGHQVAEAGLRLSATGSIVPIGSRNVGTPTAKPLIPTANSPAQKKTAPLRASGWEAGFMGGAGLSSVVGKQTSQQLTAAAYYYPSSVSSLAGNAAGRQNNANPAMHDFSFWAGVFAKRPLVKDLSLSVGLNLHYYSTQVETGQLVSSPLAASVVTASLFYNTALVSAAQTYPYYTAGQNSLFTNRYYFLEVPVSLIWQLNQGKKLPVFWEAGLSVSRLMSANALYYNSTSGLYYKDGGGVANPFQLNVSTSLMIGLSKGTTRIQVGPQIQYGLTSLVDEKIARGQHLFYGGLKFTIIPGRK